jgi:hypothetical protein
MKRVNSSSTMQTDPRRTIEAVLFSAFMALIGLGGFFLPVRRPNPFATTDYFLNEPNVSQPSQRLIHLYQRVPESEGIMVVADGKAGDVQFQYYLHTYLGWPRKLGLLNCQSPDKPYIPGADPRRIRWLLYERRRPPAELEATACAAGPERWLVPIRERREWTDFCSR